MLTIRELLWLLNYVEPEEAAKELTWNSYQQALLKTCGALDIVEEEISVTDVLPESFTSQNLENLCVLLQKV